MSECIFCKIINGEIPCHKVFEDENVLAFLDIFPASYGHTLVIPKKHIKNMFEINDEDSKGLMSGINKSVKILKEKLKVKELNVLSSNGKNAGQEIFHLHFHLIPREENDDITINWKNHKEKLEKSFQGIVDKTNN